MWIKKSYRPQVFLAPEDGSGSAPAPADTPVVASEPVAANDVSTASVDDDVATSFADSDVEQFDFPEEEDLDSLSVDAAASPPADAGTVPVEQPKPTTPPTTPTPAQPVPPVAPAEVPAAPVVPPVAPPVVPASPGSPAESAAPVAPQNFSELMEANRETFVADLARSAYQLTDADMEQLDSNAQEAIPQLLARVQYNTSRSILETMQRIIPPMIEAVTERRVASSEAESAFYSRWPGIKENPQGPALAERYAQVYRQVNPKASRDEIIRDVGAQVSHALGIVPSAVPAAASAAPLRPIPFAPASGGNAANGTSPAPANIWEGIAEQFELGDE